MTIAEACEAIPAARSVAIVHVLERRVLASHNASEGEILAALRCLELRATPAVRGDVPAPFLEYTFVRASELVVITGTGQLGLVATCGHSANLSFVTQAARRTLARYAAELD